MERALIIGASGGIGGALVRVLQARGGDVTGLSHTHDGLDVTDSNSVARVLGDVSGDFDRIIVATGILAPPGGAPEKSLRAIDGTAMAHVMAVNAMGPALVLAHLPRLLPRARPAVVGVLTARVGSIGDNHLGGWYSYRASKAAANQIVRTAAIEMARTHAHAVVVALHPGTVDTPFTANHPRQKLSPDEAAENLLRVMDGLTPDDTGGFFDWRGARVVW